MKVQIGHFFFEVPGCKDLIWRACMARVYGARLRRVPDHNWRASLTRAHDACHTAIWRASLTRA